MRLTGCNLKCALEEGPKSPGGFDCDTEFMSGRRVTVKELIEACKEHPCRNIIFTGGEPALQLTPDIVEQFHEAGFWCAIETNGTYDVSGYGLDWVTCSPKVAEHAVRCREASEVKYVRGHGQGIPKPFCEAKLKFISPAFDGMIVDARTLEWCIALVKENPEWRLSLQSHKFAHIR